MWNLDLEGCKPTGFSDNYTCVPSCHGKSLPTRTETRLDWGPQKLGSDTPRDYFLLFFLITGGSFPFTVGRIEHGHKVRPDLCAVDNQFSPRKYLGSFYTDSLVHDPAALKLLIDVIGKVSHCL